MHALPVGGSRFVGWFRAVSLLAVLLVSAGLVAGAAAADPADIQTPPRIPTKPLYSVGLNTRISAYNAQLTPLQARVSDHLARGRGWKARLNAHNSWVAGLPPTVSPSLADQIDRAAAALDAERDRLNAELMGLQAEVGQLAAEHDAIVTVARNELAALNRANPPPRTQPQPGNQRQHPHPSSNDGGNNTGNPRPTNRPATLSPQVKTLPQAPPITYDDRQFDKHFKHAKAFDVKDNWSMRAAEKFKNALGDFLASPETVHVIGSFRGQPAIINVQLASGLMVLQRPDGQFWSGWLLTDAQYDNVVNRGTL